MDTPSPIGAQPDRLGTCFRVWATNTDAVELVLYHNGEMTDRHAMQPQADGYHELYVAGVGAGTRYAFRLNNGDPRPDPASRFQPEGVHGPSEVVDPDAFRWTDDAWRGIPLEDAVIYELHVGTATHGGTFDSLIERLDDLRDLGVTMLEIMPVADFPGQYNWGYDGVDLFAPSRAYGGPEGLRRLVNAAHARGLAVILDIVYNHFGPDGNYLRDFSGNYFTSHHKTPWGDALNFDTEGSDAVRAFFIANAVGWATEYHLDGFRMDATHEIKDDTTPHILADIGAAVHAALPDNRHFLIFCENERNDTTLVRPTAENGYGLDGIWADDFHHQIRVALANEHEGYYSDYSGTPADIARTLENGWFYTGQMSQFAEQPRGTPTDGVAPPHFVHCIQNHDQVGNRALGERLNHDIAPDAYRATSTLLLLSPYTPMLWMGQEWAASTPFLYFTDHEAALGKLVTEGRRAEFSKFSAFSGATVPDPQASSTFMNSKLNWDERNTAEHAPILQLYRDLLALRRTEPALLHRDRASFAAFALGDTTLALRRSGGDQTLLLVVNLRGTFQADLAANAASTAPHGSRWEPVLDSESATYGGRGATQITGTAISMGGAGAVLLRAVAG